MGVRLGKALLCGLAGAGGVVASAAVHAAANGITTYCPWADAVVKLEIAEGRQSVTLTSALGNVPRPGRYAATLTRRVPGEPGPPETLSFMASDASYHYVFELWVFTEDLVTLSNTRIRRSDKKTWSERGYCLNEP